MKTVWVLLYMSTASCKDILNLYGYVLCIETGIAYIFMGSTERVVAKWLRQQTSDSW